MIRKLSVAVMLMGGLVACSNAVADHPVTGAPVESEAPRSGEVRATLDTAPSAIEEMMTKRCDPVGPDGGYIGRRIAKDGETGENLIDPATLPKPFRIIRPGTMVTQDYSLQRLNLILDATDTVVSTKCG